MAMFQQAGQDLGDFLQQYVPLAAAAEIKVDSYDGSCLILSAPLEKNINDKGTAFGGSLYNVCVAAAWGMTSLKCQELGLEGELVVAKAEIEYLAPLRSRLEARVQSPNQTQLDHFVQSFKKRGRASLVQEALVLDEKNQPCVKFVGKYALVS